MMMSPDRSPHSVAAHRWPLAAGALVAAAAVFIGGCGPSSPAGKAAAKTVDVVVTTPVTDRVTDFQDFTGRLEATKTVDIRAHVSGYVMEVPFKGGDPRRTA